LLNTEALYTRSRTKLSQYVIAGLHGVHITPFVYSMNHAHMIAHMQGQAWSYPLIVKSTMASRGHDNYLVHNAQELRDTLVDQPQVPFIIQDFVPNDGDYRLLVMGDSVRLALHRRSQTGSHLNNTSQGGTATIVNLADLRVEMLNDAVHIAKLLRREVTGVDMIVDAKSGEYYMLEANNMPQLSTGSMVTDKMHVFDSYIAEYFERHGASGPA
jgi:glutathione synthase/RimK-type ligase-like ATP-grasp enzyme